ncbi:MAG TPA: hypothetical protein PK228_17650 [Saprospiraceae bacterium]|nr:hypothetical protein [Saprospiraceae bacterium]
MDKVFIVHHIHRFDDEDEDVKLIGVFSTEENAKKSIASLLEQPGFKDHPEGFEIGEFYLDEYSWKEGFITV